MATSAINSRATSSPRLSGIPPAGFSRLARLLAEETATDADPATRFAATWDRVVQSLGTTGPLWAVQFELLAHIQRDPALRESFADATRPARLGPAGIFGHGADEETALTVGAFYQALLSGLAAQAMADPASVPLRPRPSRRRSYGRGPPWGQRKRHPDGMTHSTRTGGRVAHPVSGAAG